MVKAAFVYLFGGVLNRAIPFLLLPVLTHYLAPAEYGTLAIYQVLLTFTIPFVGMNMHNNISRNFARSEHGEIARLIGTLIGLLGVSTTIVSLIVILWAILGGPFFGVPAGWVMALPLVAAMAMAHQFNLTVLRNQQRAWTFGGFELSNTFLELLLSLVLVVGVGFGWQGRAAGAAAATICFGLLGLAALRHQRLLVFELDRKLLSEVLSISLPLIPHALGGIVIAMSDRLFLDRMLSKEAVGLYAVGCSFGMIVNLVVEAFNRAWNPWFFKKMTRATEVDKAQIVKYTYVYFAGVAFLAVVVTCVSLLLMPFMVAPEYQNAASFVAWIAFSYAFRGMYTMVFPYLVYVGKTGFLGVGMFITATTNLVVNYILIGANGTLGAAQATLIAWAMLFIITWVYAARICPMPWIFMNKSISLP